MRKEIILYKNLEHTAENLKIVCLHEYIKIYIQNKKKCIKVNFYSSLGTRKYLTLRKK